MKDKKKPHGIKHKIREKKKREERIGLVVIVAILVAIIFISSFLINSMLNQPSTSQIVSSASELKSAIVDHLSLTYPNQTFIQTAKNTLKQAGFTVDYYPGEKVTVELYRNLPLHNYGLVILRVHSTATLRHGEEDVEGPGALFTSEPYSTTKYVDEQLTGKITSVGYLYGEDQTLYFGIRPAFIKSSNGRFPNSTIIMMGCDGLRNTEMAKAFLNKGAKVYISWNQQVLSNHTDLAITCLLQHFLIEKLTIKEAITETFLEVGADPSYNSLLLYYPLEAGNYTIQNIVGYLVTSAIEIQHKALPKKDKNRQPLNAL